MSSVMNLPLADHADRAAIQQVFEKQQGTALQWRESTAAERITRIKRLRDAVLEKNDEIVKAAAADFNKPEVEVDLTEVLPVISEANHTMRHLKKWMKPRSVMPTQLMLGTKSYIQYEPKGTSLIISPWNYPVNLTFVPLVSALAAGCPAIIKPSEMTPHLSGLMSDLIRSIFSEDEVAVFQGDAQTSQALLELPFNHIFFTGSPAIGKVVMAAASKHLTSVTLELGGKSPTVIDQTADLGLAARNIMFGKFTNNGQTCIAPDHIYVHESVKNAFVSKCAEVIKAWFGDNADEQKNRGALARIVNQRHSQRVAGLLEDATEKGAVVLTGGAVDIEQAFVAPTLLEDIPSNAQIMSEEIFGPLLPIISYQSVDEVIENINADEKPLALYLWSKNSATTDKIMRKTSSGGACINHTVVHYLHQKLPFGGVNNSGIGASHGHFGFMEFTHRRSVVKTRFMMARLFFPPHGRLVRVVMKLLKRFV